MCFSKEMQNKQIEWGKTNRAEIKPDKKRGHVTHTKWEIKSKNKNNAQNIFNIAYENHYQ